MSRKGKDPAGQAPVDGGNGAAEMIAGLPARRAEDPQAIWQLRQRLASVNRDLGDALRQVVRGGEDALRHLDANDEYIDQTLMRNAMQIDGLSTERGTIIRALLLWDYGRPGSTP